MTSGPDLAVVSSPLQYVNAVEWRASVGFEPCDLLLIGDRHARGGVEALMRRASPWRTLMRHGRRPRPAGPVPRLVRDALDAGHRSSLERLSSRLGAAGYAAVALGDYRNVSQRLLVDRIGAARPVLLDDGSVTPQAAAFRADPAGAPEPRQFDLAWFRTSLARRLFGDAPLPEPEALSIFTIYHRALAGRVAARDSLIGHDYSFWKSRTAPHGARGEGAWFIGSDHVEAKICDLETYRALVAAAADHLRGEGRRSIAYRPHRGEDLRKAGDLAQAAGMTVTIATAPAELDYLDARERPATVAVIASSVADTLSVLDPDLDIVRFAAPPGYLRRRASHIEAVVAMHDAFNPRLRVIDPGVGETIR